MNESLKTGPQGLRLLMDYEKGDDSVPLSENGAALAPYVCPGDELTIGYGCTHWFDGEPVQIHHRLATESDALNLLMQNLTSYEDCVRGALTREAAQHQFDGMVCLCFNIGKGAFLGSSVLKSFNAGRMEDAAANFGLWTGSTTARPRKKQIDNPDYAPKLKQDHRGLWRWIGPEGQYCAYMLRLGGLLSRHYAEALLFMGRDYVRTLHGSTAMELVLTPTLPAEADWDAGKGRWIDKVRYRTPFKDVYAAAYDDRLDAPVVAPADVKETPVPSHEPVVAAKTPVSVDTNTGPSPPVSRPAPVVVPQPAGAGAGQPAQPLPKLTPKPTPPIADIPKKPPSKFTVPITDAPYRIDPNFGLKPMEESQRWQASLAQNGGMVLMRLARYGLFGTTPATVATFIEKDPIFSGAFLALLGCCVIYSVGYVRKCYGDWQRHHAERIASQGLY